jgi:glutamyl-tRNA reductase
VELYTARESGDGPVRPALAGFLADCRGLDVGQLDPHLYEQADEAAVRHLFTVAASLDSMVVGEPQILAQVKLAYQTATEQETAGPLLHAAFQASLKAARRVAGETALHQRRVSIPSVAVADFAQQIFEHFGDKHALVIGAGEMAEETLLYLRDQGVREVTVVNRSPARSEELAARWQGRSRPWGELLQALATADLVISTTGADEPIVTAEAFRSVEEVRQRRPLFVLDLAVPRDFDPAIGDRPDVYLYSIDDLRLACDRNRAERDKELPAARRIIEQETARFMGDLHHRATGPVIRQLREGWQKPMEEELRRLFNKLPDLDERARAEIREAFERLINKLLHLPLASLRDEARHGIPSALVEALAKLFHLRD